MVGSIHGYCGLLADGNRGVIAPESYRAAIAAAESLSAQPRLPRTALRYSRQARSPAGKPYPRTGIRNGNYPQTGAAGASVRLLRHGSLNGPAGYAARLPIRQIPAQHT